MNLKLIVLGLMCTLYGVCKGAKPDCSGSTPLTETYANTKAVPVRTEIDPFGGKPLAICEPALRLLNEERARHQGTGALTYNDALAKQSEAWAINLAKLAETNQLTVKHSTRTGGEGENIDHYKHRHNSIIDHSQPVSWAVGEWNTEGMFCRYNYATAKGSCKTSSFTQNVWVGTTQVGCGSAKIVVKDVTHYFVVCQYLPAGNKIVRRTGKTEEEDRLFAYTSNVKPLKPGESDMMEFRELERIENESFDRKRELIDLVQLLLRSKN